MASALERSPAAALTTPGPKEQRATRLAFFIAGFGISAWAPLVPFAKNRLGLDDSVLGLVLLCLGGGSIVTMPLAGALAARFGCRLVIAVASALIAVTLPLLATVANLPALVFTLVVFGAAVGSVDCVINIQAIIVERASGRPMMSGFHGLFSVGGIIGAGGVSALLSAGVSPLAAVSIVAVGVVLTILLAVPGLLTYGSARQGPAFAVPHGVVLFIGVLCFIVFMSEGSVLDWSAVFLTSERGVDPRYAGYGYAFFAFAMTACRLTGDAIVHRLGSEKVVWVGGGIAALGLALVALVPAVWVAMLGFLLLGVGCSNIVPVLFTAVGRQHVMPESVAVPAITTLGYAGMLVGPAAIGFVAHAASLAMAFLLIGLLAVGVAASARVLRQQGLT